MHVKNDGIAKLSIDGVQPRVGAPAGWVVIEGNPEATAWPSYASEGATRTSGVWQSTPGTYRARYEKWEFCHVLEGSCVITPDNGAAVALKAGDVFVVEPGFEGTWQILETMKKHYVFVVVA